eukprot:NODE_50_length_31184_cov_0.705099.p32 type:complete len:101 gc:universal NODE_50_length_31184_cov_0.705099:16238-15936(-)
MRTKRIHHCHLSWCRKWRLLVRVACAFSNMSFRIVCPLVRLAAILTNERLEVDMNSNVANQMMTSLYFSVTPVPLALPCKFLSTHNVDMYLTHMVKQLFC